MDKVGQLTGRHGKDALKSQSTGYQNKDIAASNNLFVYNRLDKWVGRLSLDLIPEWTDRLDNSRLELHAKI